MESLQAVNRYLRITWALVGFGRGCAKIRPGSSLGAAGFWRPLRISTGLTQAFQNLGQTDWIAEPWSGLATWDHLGLRVPNIYYALTERENSEIFQVPESALQQKVIQ
ncbi:hypothetical protein HOY80DRAFT_1056959 [Tuber brumale]|nr:hypothetical protein HOY80DRAFT_1056959 [Tuber brumale]